jgi:hypothetical protein
MQYRFGSSLDKVVLVPPSVCSALADEGPLHLDHGGEMQAFVERVDSAEHVVFVIHSEGPSHYTFLRTSKNAEGARAVEFKDSIRGGTGTSSVAARNILVKLSLVPEDFAMPEPANKLFQADGWSCGLWVMRWIEHFLREMRGEATLPYERFSEVIPRVNEFISKIVNATSKATAQAKAKAKALAKTGTKGEPVYDTFEKALWAALKCTKCVTTKFGTKGCRGCMGEWFEEMRLNKYKGRVM